MLFNGTMNPFNIRSTHLPLRNRRILRQSLPSRRDLLLLRVAFWEDVVVRVSALWGCQSTRNHRPRRVAGEVDGGTSFAPARQVVSRGEYVL